ncbi:DUF1599 domain-containing protein [Paramuribaculum intestinale]|jgi:Domain of Unknown Function (DUF1599).|uniref:nucleotide modification associated domain-containing protein n=1 Tax=Bacteroidales TaxID=171549 RepID=UPI001981A813|nr:MULTISPECIES: nucleotide modification associated domain-containing protein [Bacteroidales]WLT41083.1 DUF1599 domain-containing protein [Paramuribaculum intestinale]
MEQNNNPRVIDFSNDLESVNDDKSPDVKAFKNTVSKMTDIFIAKNHDYGNSFGETVRELGVVAGFAPIMHKFNRLKNIIKGNTPLVEGETIEDTLLDMANYCIMLNMEISQK